MPAHAEVIDLHFDLAEDEIGASAPGPALRPALLEIVGTPWNQLS